MTTDVEARMEQVLGGPPRLRPLDEEALGERELELIERMRELTRYPADKPIHAFFSTLAHQPAFFEAYMQLGITAIGAASLPPRDRELLILRTGWLCGAPYQFGEHVVMARQLGFSAEQIDWIKQGSAAEGWNEDDRALLRAAEELHDNAMISDADVAGPVAAVDAGRADRADDDRWPLSHDRLRSELAAVPAEPWPQRPGRGLG